jgi:hypothetical protein
MDRMNQFTANSVKPFKPKPKLDGIGFLGTDCKRVATTDLRVLQDTPTR